MPNEPFETSQLYELSTWETLIKSDEWQVYLKLCEDHKEYLTKQCLICVLKADFHNAVCYAAKVEDVDKKIDLVKQSLKKLRIGGEDAK
jgi:hypothetical protein